MFRPRSSLFVFAAVGSVFASCGSDRERVIVVMPDSGLPEDGCNNSLDCTEPLICDRTTGRCVECVQDGDCDVDRVCAGNVCRGMCESDNDCRAAGQLCNLEQGHCVDCVLDADCEENETCTALGTCTGEGSGGSGGASGSGGDAGSGGDQTGGSAGAGGSGAGGTGGGETGGGGGTDAGGSGGGGGSGGSQGPATVVFLIDRSSSMTEAFADGDAGPSRWTTVNDVLFAENGPIAANQSRIRFGLYTFTYQNTLDPSCPAVRGVGPSTGNLAALNAYLAAESVPGLMPKGETPTGEAVANLTSTLAGISGAKTVILITDGQSDTCERLDPQCGYDETVQAVQAAFAHGITTRIIGLGADMTAGGGEWPEFLQGVANAGLGRGVAPPSAMHESRCYSPTPWLATYAGAATNARFYQTPADDLAASIAEILAGIP